MFNCVIFRIKLKFLDKFLKFFKHFVLSKWCNPLFFKILKILFICCALIFMLFTIIYCTIISHDWLVCYVDKVYRISTVRKIFWISIFCTIFSEAKSLSVAFMRSIYAKFYILENLISEMWSMKGRKFYYCLVSSYNEIYSYSFIILIQMLYNFLI